MITPITAKELMDWLGTRFVCNDAAPRAYMEFPVVYDEKLNPVYIKRIVHRVVGLEGLECNCVRELFNVFNAIPEGENLFIRRKFEFDRNFEGEIGDGRLVGRLAFWNEKMNDVLAAHGVVVADNINSCPLRRIAKDVV